MTVYMVAQVQILDPELWERYKEIAAREIARHGGRYLARGASPEIAQPVLVVNGSSDVVIPTINSYHLYQHLPDAELWLLPDSGHGAHFQYPARFVRRVIDFLDVQPHGPALPAGPFSRDER